MDSRRPARPQSHSRVKRRPSNLIPTKFDSGGSASYLMLLCLREGAFPLAYHNWRRRLPRPIVIPKVMTLATLEDVRALVHRHLPAEYRAKDTWQRVASITTAAARGQLPAEEVAVALKLVLSMEGIACQ
jgi:hypothetical protein